MSNPQRPGNFVPLGSIAQDARDEDEVVRRREAEARDLEVIYHAPMRELREEWDSAWESLRDALAPYLADQSPGRDTRPDALAALRRVAAAIKLHDLLTIALLRFQGWWPHATPTSKFVTLQGRLVSVEDFRDHFTHKAPVYAAALVRFALSLDDEQFAAEFRTVTDNPKYRPALGWLLYARDCLWPREFGAMPAEIRGAGAVWHIKDSQRLQYLLGPEERSFGGPTMKDLFPYWEEPRQLALSNEEVSEPEHGPVHLTVAALPEPVGPYVVTGETLHSRDPITDKLPAGSAPAKPRREAKKPKRPTIPPKFKSAISNWSKWQKKRKVEGVKDRIEDFCDEYNRTATRLVDCDEFRKAWESYSRQKRRYDTLKRQYDANRQSSASADTADTADT
jgi:hypothetical protein